MNTSSYKRCYFFRNADFFRRASIIDSAVAAYTDGTLIYAILCLNPLSPRYEKLKASAILLTFQGDVEDPTVLENSKMAFILDTDLNRNDESPLLEFLKNKYQTRPLMNFDLGYTRISQFLPNVKV